MFLFWFIIDRKPKKHVTWDESVVDNEFMNKKKSNKCCIYHKPRRWDESDSEESSYDEEHFKEKKKNMNTNTTATISKTETVTQTEEEQRDKAKQERHVTWDESVIDNEFMNKKKSNKCCIYHKPRKWDESDSEDSDSSSDYQRDPNYKKPDLNQILNTNAMDMDSDTNDKSQIIQKHTNMTSDNHAKSEKDEDSINTSK